MPDKHKQYLYVHSKPAQDTSYQLEHAPRSLGELGHTKTDVVLN